MTEKIKYAIIGAGCMGQEHILNIGIIDDAEVVALCDTSEKSIQESLELLNDEVAIFHDYNDLIDANIADAFIIATPNFTHIDVLKDVMKSEAHLLIEKPLCTTVKDCQEFEKLAENYELSGGAMTNVIRYGAINSLQMDRSEMSQEDLVEGITKELQKEGKTA